jgi:hypothetical protein
MVMSKPEKILAKPGKPAGNGAQAGSKGKAGQKRNRKDFREPTANELMLKAWQKIYETRQQRLL